MLYEFFDSTVSLGLSDHFSLVRTPVNSAVSLLSSSSPILPQSPVASPAQHVPSPNSSPLHTSPTSKPQSPGKRPSVDNSIIGPPSKTPRQSSVSATSLAPAEVLHQLPVDVHQPPALADEGSDVISADGDAEEDLGQKKMTKKCSICSRSVDKRSFARHVRLHDDGAPTVTCNLCAKEFDRMDSLNRHQRENCPR